MRVVIDTNVFVSAALKQTSVPAIAIDAVEQHGVFLKSVATEQRWLQSSELVEVTERVNICRDPTDDKFLEVALNGHADFVVSGDADLLTLNPFRQIAILSPAAFLAVLAG